MIKQMRVIVVLLACIAMSLACSLSSGDSDEDNPTAVPVIQTQTQTPQTPTTSPTSTSIPTATSSSSGNQNPSVPTAAAPPTVASGGNGSTLERLSFATGATQLIKADVPLGAHLLKEYLIRVQEGQTMTVDLSSRDANYLSLTIVGASDGAILAEMPPSQTTLPIWSGNIPSTQDYVIRIGNLGNATTFTLNVIVPRRITFDAGATSATLQGSVSGGMVVDYVIRAQGGQTMTVTVSSPNNDVHLTIYGISDGQPYLRADLGQTTWSMQLPSTQDYGIKAVSHGSATTYTLTVTVIG